MRYNREGNGESKNLKEWLKNKKNEDLKRVDLPSQQSIQHQEYRI